MALKVLEVKDALSSVMGESTWSDLPRFPEAGHLNWPGRLLGVAVCRREPGAFEEKVGSQRLGTSPKIPKHCLWVSSVVICL